MINRHKVMWAVLTLTLAVSACSRKNPAYKVDGQVNHDQGPSHLDQGTPPPDGDVPPFNDQFVPPPPPQDQLLPPPPPQDQLLPPPPQDQLVLPPPQDQLVPPPPQDQLVPPPPQDQFVPPPDKGPGPCPVGKTRCNGVCVDMSMDDKNCGKCGLSCGGGYCHDALCCPTTDVNCNGVCVNLKSDSKNCGKCGTTCTSGESCASGVCQVASTTPCADTTQEQTFNKGMVGCAGTVEWSQRATLCGKNHRVCKANEWVDRRSGKSPAFNYWTDDELRYNGYYAGFCYVSETSGGKCGGSPMRVCVSTNKGQDSLGNKCNWYHCGYKQYQPNQYFGGCQGNKTAGAICCPK